MTNINTHAGKGVAAPVGFMGRCWCGARKSQVLRAKTGTALTNDGDGNTNQEAYYVFRKNVTVRAIKTEIPEKVAFAGSEFGGSRRYQHL